MDQAGSPEVLRFGPFELDPDAEELRRSGVIVRLPPQPFRILLLLAGRAGETVSRDEIHAAIWGKERYVDFEHGINSAIRHIRYVLGDHAETPRYIRTVPRHGYSFIAAVERIARPDQSLLQPHDFLQPQGVVQPQIISPPRTRRIAPRLAVIAGMTLLAVAVMLALIAGSGRPIDERKSSVRTVAVLPFRSLGPAIAGVNEPSFAEELRAVIGRLPSERISLIEAGAPGHADIVIDGTIRRSQDGVRVIVSVANAASQTQIWSETFQRPENGKEGLAVEVAHRVMHEIARRYLPPPRREPPLVTNAPPAAIALYKRARQMHLREQAYDWMRTKELYEAAIRQQPRFAEAWSGLSDVWTSQALSGPEAECDRAAVRAADCAHRALSLQPRNAEAYSALAVIAAQRDYDLVAAEDALRRAIAADPGYVDARTNLAMVLAMRGEAEDSLREFALAQQLDPIGLDLSRIEPLLYLYARRYEDARARFREILTVDPQSQAASWGLLSTSIAQKNWSEAVSLAAALRQIPADNVPRTEDGFFKFYCGFESYMLEARRQGRFNDYFLAVYYAQCGNRDRSFEMLKRAIDTHTPSVSYIMVDPRLDNLRSDRRFRPLLAQIKLGRPPG
ncbi:MAG TPA: winged helix-turn-helix domain-containing protein [Thermoanaerobaculia bacterium]|jgi:DNA-binding winged helix-turn-helix (wHTH) protein/tetratricopeptide (TPR) repeat protein|nr:winged helix-turn-helix domain-containing protein [Thermoanaerobaculia bacterium]